MLFLLLICICTNFGHLELPEAKVMKDMFAEVIAKKTECVFAWLFCHMSKSQNRFWWAICELHPLNVLETIITCAPVFQD